MTAAVAGRAGLLSALVAALAVGAAAAAQQAPPPGQRLVLPAPSDPSWPPDGTPPSAEPQAAARIGPEPAINCGLGLPCRLRLRGVLGGNNGGIALEGTAFIW